MPEKTVFFLGLSFVHPALNIKPASLGNKAFPVPEPFVTLRVGGRGSNFVHKFAIGIVQEVSGNSTLRKTWTLKQIRTMQFIIPSIFLDCGAEWLKAVCKALELWCP